MTDQDYIKAGVKLADGGWTYHDGDCSHEETERWFIGCKLPQVWLDALAAQLARQYRKRYVLARFLTDDRLFYEDDPMITIKAIVDSGKLK